MTPKTFALAALLLASSAAQAISSVEVTASGWGAQNYSYFYDRFGPGNDGYRLVPEADGVTVMRKAALVNSNWFSVYEPAYAQPMFNDGVYPALYRGFGAAYDETGMLRVKAETFSQGLQGMAPWRSMTTTAAVSGEYVLGGAAQAGGTFEHTLNLHFDGTLTPGQPGFVEVRLSARNLQDGTWQSATFNAGNEPFQSLDDQIALTLQGQAGDRFQVFAQLSATLLANYPAGSTPYVTTLDFSHTAQLSFALPQGVSFAGEGGFLSAVPLTVASVPEPASWAALLAGLAVLAAPGARRRRG
jgi:hypothetical protein